MAGQATAIKLREFKDWTPYFGTAYRQGNDVHGLYPGQLGRVHKDLRSEAAIGFQTPAVSRETETHHQPDYQPDFDLLTLERSINSQMGNRGNTSYMETTYKEAFSLPFYNLETDYIKCTPVSHKGPLKK